MVLEVDPASALRRAPGVFAEKICTVNPGCCLINCSMVCTLDFIPPVMSGDVEVEMRFNSRRFDEFDILGMVFPLG